MNTLHAALSKLDCPEGLVASLVLDNDGPAGTCLQALSRAGQLSSARAALGQMLIQIIFKNLSGWSPLQLETVEAICSNM